MEKRLNRQLDLVIMPDGSLNLEYGTGEAAASPRSQQLQEKIHGRWTADPDECLLFIGFCDKSITLSPSLDYLRDFASAFVRKLRRIPDIETLRHRAHIPLEEGERFEFLQRMPLMTGAEYVNPGVLQSVWDRLENAFAVAVESFDGTVEAFIRSYRPDVHVAGRVYFHLVENKDGEYPFAFLATYSTRLDAEGKSRHLPLRHALQEYGEQSAKLLELLVTVHRAAEKSALIAQILDSGELFHPLGWTAGEAFTFLKEVPLYEEAGILCRIPNWWKAKTSSLGLTISIGDKQPSFVGMNAILNFSPKLLLGGQEITEAEARKLLEESEGLAFIKNRWVAADPEKIEQTLEAYEKAKALMAQGFTLRDALRLQLNPENFLDEKNAKEIEFSNGQWLKSVMAKLIDPVDIPSADPGEGFCAKLRPYQQKGLDWLWFLHSLKFGACLADDMGLGKTVQLLGFLSALKTDPKNQQNASLLIIPASLIPNWTSEIERFAPDLKFYVAHPSAHRANGKKAQPPEDTDILDLVITTYALAQKYDWLRTHTWNYVILDEAQAIKNPGTRQTRAVKKLSAQNRIVMTGTPIENRLSDLWSLFDFLNPGLLGTSKEFGAFAKNIGTDASGYGRLRKIISPYILRRMKTDRAVISDLPDKVEMKTYADLSKKQVVLYGQLVADLARIIDETDGIARKGLILASLMKFKQICNHPDQYLGTGGFDEADSGKFARLKEICETIYEKREKVLVFTQFKEMTQPLSEFLAGVFQREGLILHGSVAVGKRKKLIETFQNEKYVPFMVLSLKAGGVGLNLTAANHVIHFDRWWNPAVEDQATDRAFRIGQKKNVMVHKFLTRGTVEEKIDRMLGEKQKLTREVVAATGESWITEMKTDELMDMFRLTL